MRRLGRRSAPRPFRALAGLVVLAALAGGAGCQSVGQGRSAAEVEVSPGRTTREDLYRGLGLPQAVAIHGNGVETLVYRHVWTRGMGAGLAILMSPIEMGNKRSRTASVFIDLARNDVVIGIRRNGGDIAPGWSLWPWGEGSAED